MADLLTNNILTLMPSINECRLTLETGVPVSTTDQTGKTTVYLTPYTGNRLALFNGTSWGLYSLAADKSLALGTLTSGKNYDVFAYDSSGTVTLELSAAWTNDTTRADALTTQDGILVKSGALTRRYLGTLRTTSTTTTEDSGGYTGTTQVGAKRFLWNYSNRVRRPLFVKDTTNTWSYTTNTVRVANGATAPLNCVEYVTGDASLTVQAAFYALVGLSGNSARGARTGIGLDSSTTISGFSVESYVTSATPINAASVNTYGGSPGLGYHFLSMLEAGSDGTCVFIGDNAGTCQSGLTAFIEG